MLTIALPCVIFAFKHFPTSDIAMNVLGIGSMRLASVSLARKSTEIHELQSVTLAHANLLISHICTV